MYKRKAVKTCTLAKEDGARTTKRMTRREGQRHLPYGEQLTPFHGTSSASDGSLFDGRKREKESENGTTVKVCFSNDTCR